MPVRIRSRIFGASRKSPITCVSRELEIKDARSSAATYASSTRLIEKEEQVQMNLGDAAWLMNFPLRLTMLL